MRMHALIAAISLMLAAPLAHAEVAGDSYFWRPAVEDAEPRPWVVLLPGSGGMSILGDDEHYFRAATWLNERGVDALVVDYHGAARYVPAAAEGAPGDRIAAVVADAVATERARGRVQAQCPAAIIGWSLGGEGAWTLAQSNDRVFRGVAMFYPTVRRPQPYSNALPVLVLQGTSDNVTLEADLRAFVDARSSGSAAVQVARMEGAGHGFDVPSLQPPRTMRFPPLIGQRVTLAYDPHAAARANVELEAFLREIGVVGGACASN